MFIFGLQVHLQRIRVRLIYEGHRVKVTKAKKIFAGGLPSIEKQSCFQSDLALLASVAVSLQNRSR